MNPHSPRPDIVDLIGPRFDRVNSEPAEKTLIICAAPRSGSYELSRILMAAGIGVTHEYFHPDFAAIVAARWGLPPDVLSPNELGSYISQLRKRRSAGGVFATKLQHWQYVASLRNSHGRALFDGAVVVHLFRADAARQFVSWHRAQESGRYDFSNRTTDAPGSPEQLLEKRQLVTMANFLVAEDAGFRRLFIMSGIHPIFVEFNELRRDLRPIIEEIGRALEVPLDREGLSAALAATAPYDHGADSAQDRERRISSVFRGSAFETGPNDTSDNEGLARAAWKPREPGSASIGQIGEARIAMQLPSRSAMTIPSPLHAVEKKNLILINHPARQDWRDFAAIAQEIVRLAPDICVYIVAPNDAVEEVDNWQRRSLIVSFGQAAFNPPRGMIFMGRWLAKYKENSLLAAAGVRVPVTSLYRPGQRFDFSSHRPLVVAKPTKQGSMSHGDHVVLMRRERVDEVVPARFGPELTMDADPVIVQDFVDTGARASHFRVLLLFGEPLLSYQCTLTAERPSLDAPDAELESAQIATNAPDRTVELIADAEVIEFAKKASRAIWWMPLQGMDVAREAGSGALYVIEANVGGNSWSFSSRLGERLRKLLGGAEPLKAQFGAWTVAAKALIRATRTYAE